MLKNFDTKHMKIVFWVTAIVVIYLLLVLIVSGIAGIVTKVKEYKYVGRDNAYGNIVSFTGEGKVYTKPDIAMITLSVVTNAPTVAAVEEKNTEKMNTVIDFLKKTGVEEKDIKTTNYQLYPQYNYEYTKVPQITGYQITQSVEVKIRNLDKVGEILGGSTNAGVNQVSSLYFQVDKDEEFKSQARELAIADAKKKAEETAKQLGIKLGKITGFSENNLYNPVPYTLSAYRYEAQTAGGAAPDIQIGENEILVNITITYEID